MKLRARTASAILVAALTVSILSGCVGGPQVTVTPTNTTNSTTTILIAEVPTFDNIVFPEIVPDVPLMSDSTKYGYDDMGKKFDLEFFSWHYGATPPSDENNPVTQYLNKKYNVNITFTTVTQADQETVLSTRFASGDAPDIMTIPNKDFAMKLSEGELLLDAKEYLPYMPHMWQFMTKDVLEWSTDTKTGKIPYIAPYGVASNQWCYAIRQDWLDTFGMEMPKTQEQLIAYAKACTENDPDDNGKSDTYFMSPAGGGAGFGMLDVFRAYFGDMNAYKKDDGTIYHPMLDGSTKEFLMFINELVTNNYLSPDWYTIDWETNKTYTMGDKVGMILYPPYYLFLEFTDAHNKSMESLDVWKYPETLFMENAKNMPGSTSALIALSANGFQDNAKMMRAAHILDNMAYRGEDFFATIQGGGNVVYEGMGLDYVKNVEKYNEDGTAIIIVDKSHPGYTKYGNNNLEIAPWQQFFFFHPFWARAPEDDTAFSIKKTDLVNQFEAQTKKYPAHAPNQLFISIPGDIAPNLADYVKAQELNFVLGKRGFDEWDSYVQEWLDKGGKDVLEATAKSLGASLPASVG